MPRFHAKQKSFIRLRLADGKIQRASFPPPLAEDFHLLRIALDDRRYYRGLSGDRRPFSWRGRTRLRKTCGNRTPGEISGKSDPIERQTANVDIVNDVGEFPACGEFPSNGEISTTMEERVTSHSSLNYRLTGTISSLVRFSSLLTYRTAMIVKSIQTSLYRVNFLSW